MLEITFYHIERVNKLENIKIRMEITKQGLKHQEVAEILGITRTSFSRKIATELPKAEQKRIIDAIRAYKKGQPNE